ncbi:MAG: DNA adenine methylase [Leeuwenhoekiella sp.]
MSGNKSKLIAFNYFGGKFSFIDEIYPHFPVDFTHLVDLFAGSFVVSLNYKGKVIKTANEINEEVTNFFKVLRDRPDELLQQLQLTPCSNAEFDNCWNTTGDDLERARSFYVRVRQSFYGMGVQRQNKGWHMAKQQCNAEGGETVSKWKNALPKLYEVAKVIAENFQITNFNYLECIDKIDFPHAFFYCDPPYPLSCRASQNDYRFEFTDDDHIALFERLQKIEGRAMVSSYNNDLYEKIYGNNGWTKVLLKPKKNNIRSGMVQEVIWYNYPQTEAVIAQNSLFNEIQQCG